MSYLNKKKFVKIKEQINQLGFDGEIILKFIKEEGYDEFLFLSNNIDIEKDEEFLIIIADLVHLVIEKENENYILKIE